MRVDKLEGTPLDYAVATALKFMRAPVYGVGTVVFKHGFWAPARRGQQPYVLRKEYDEWARQCDDSPLTRSTEVWQPSSNWAHGGPIKNKYHISTECNHSGLWLAWVYDLNDEKRYMQCDREELVAAMRCLVEGHLGKEVDIPKELL